MSKKQEAYSASDFLEKSGVNVLFNQPTEYLMIPLDLIDVRDQIRTELEDEENSLQDLADSILEHGVLQPVLLRPSDIGYTLVAGERRFLASKLAGLKTIPAYIRDMTDEEAEAAQLAENIQRKNLTQLEESRKIQRDLEKLGSTEALLKQYNKSKGWLSKRLAILNLPKQTQRLVSEFVSADIELINEVRIVEGINPEKARELVNDLKVTRGKKDARAKVRAIKDAVKPPKKAKVNTEKKQTVANETPCSPLEILAQITIDEISNLREMTDEKLALLEKHLSDIYIEGKNSEDLTLMILAGLRSNRFSTSEDIGLLSLVAALQSGSGRPFNLNDITGYIRKLK